MTDREHLFDPQEVEKQVDQLFSARGETFGTSQLDQRFLHDLRLVLAAKENDAQSETDEHILNSAWARITATGSLSQNTMQEGYSSAQQRRFTTMSTLPSTPDRLIARHSSFKRRLTMLVAALVALALAGTFAVFTVNLHGQQQPHTGTGSPNHSEAAQTTRPAAHNYTYYRAGQLPVSSVQWSSDGTRIISADENVTAWDAFSGAHEVQFALQPANITGPEPLPYFVQLSPNDKTLAVCEIGQIDLYDAATGKHISTLTYPFGQTPGAKFYLPGFSPYLSWSSDGKFIRALAGFPDGNSSRTNKLVVYNAATGTHQDVSLSLTGLLDQVAWSPNGQYVAVGRTSEGTVSVLNVADGQVVSSLHVGAPIETIPVSWSPDSSKLIADFNGQGDLYVWDAATAKNVVTHQGVGTEPAWSPDGKYIATINQATINILHAATGKVVHTYTDPAISDYATVAWAPDGSALAAGGVSTGGRGGLVSVWKILF